MNQKKAKQVRKDLGIKPKDHHISHKDSRYYRTLGTGQLVCIGERKAYKLAKKALIRRSKGSE